jgi:hypothetical protein
MLTETRPDNTRAQFAPYAGARGVVLTYAPSLSARPDGHEVSTLLESAHRLARLKGFVDGGQFDASAPYPPRRYFVPHETLASEAAMRLGIRSEDDLYGGVVPYPYVATKTITHRLASPGSRSPEGWCDGFPRRVNSVVLDGYSAFDADDALEVGRRLLEFGPIRVKLASGIAGHGQVVADTSAALVAALDRIDPDDISRTGLVVEQNLTDVVTYSVGQFRVTEAMGSYYGTQEATTNNHGATVYGGSTITAVRGGYDRLLSLRLPHDIRQAIIQARIYDEAANECFHGFYASRRNYDVARGLDASGHPRSGVLEQSWRAGGASGAEISALEAFCHDPSLRAVRALTREVYGKAPILPPNASVYFAGSDPHAGLLTKYAWVENNADTG